MPRNSERQADIAPLLLIDGEAPRAAALASEVNACFARVPAVVEVRGGRQACEALRTGRFDIVVADIDSLVDLTASAEEAVARLVKLADGALMIVLSEAASISASVAVLRAGAHDCLVRPVDGQLLATRVEELARRHSKAHLLDDDDPAARVRAALNGLIGASSEMQALSQLMGGGAAGDLQQMRDLVRHLAETLDARPAGGSIPASDERWRPGETRQPAVEPMWKHEQRIIEDAIARYCGNVAMAAAALELSPSTIYRKRQAWAEMADRRGAA